MVKRYTKDDLKKIEAGEYRTKDGHFWIAREDPYRPRRGWWVRHLTGDFADPDGQWEPMVLDNGLAFADSLKDALQFIPEGSYPVERVSYGRTS
jgi:hypothetical protein